MHTQVARGLRNAHPAFLDQAYRLKLELPRKLPSLHDPPPAPSKHLTRCLWNRVQANPHGAIKQTNRSGPIHVDATMTEFRKRYFDYAKQHAPGLRMNEPKKAGPQETWFYLKYPGLPKGAFVYHKSHLGTVDLTIPNIDADKLRPLISPCLEYGIPARAQRSP